MIKIIIKSICYYLIIAAVLAVLGFSISIYYSIMILLSLIGIELTTDDESYTAIYFSTDQEEE